uniref:Uncharacterized protein n=1 Tax=Trichobilharzia regenti TaxID=157069 RepID=A0AA85JM21_TRIRE|nr:unnamed protein product [Trichobilharzia regenti]
MGVDSPNCQQHCFFLVIYCLESNSWWERRDALELISNHLKASTLPNGLVSQVTEGLYQVISPGTHSMLVIQAAGVLRE